MGKKMTSRVTVRIEKSSGVTLETLKISSITGVYTSPSMMETRYFIVYTNIFGCQSLETARSDYKLLVGVLDIPELNI